MPTRTAGAGIARLTYQPRKHGAQAGNLALVGKGICFDTGGINLKTHRGMYLMHGDMQGSAVALGTLLALSRLGAPNRIDCWLAITENEIGPVAYRPQEVVRASNGVTIQVVHSDAEGRMVLADTLALASREKPAFMLDFATLDRGVRQRNYRSLRGCIHEYGGAARLVAGRGSQQWRARMVFPDGRGF